MFKYLKSLQDKVNKGFINYNNFKKGYEINSNGVKTEFIIVDAITCKNIIVYKELTNTHITFGTIILDITPGNNNIQIIDFKHEYYNTYYLNVENKTKIKDDVNIFKNNSNRALLYYKKYIDTNQIQNKQIHKLLIYHNRNNNYKYYEFNNNYKYIECEFNNDLTSMDIHNFKKNKMFEIKLIDKSNYSYKEYSCKKNKIENKQLINSGKFNLDNLDNLDIYNLDNINNDLYEIEYFDNKNVLYSKINISNDEKITTDYIDSKVTKISKCKNDVLHTVEYINNINNIIFKKIEYTNECIKETEYVDNITIKITYKNIYNEIYEINYFINDKKTYDINIKINNDEFFISYIVNVLNNVFEIKMNNKNMINIKNINNNKNYDIIYTNNNDSIHINIKDKYECDYNGNINNEKYLNISVDEVDMVIKIIKNLLGLVNRYIKHNKPLFNELSYEFINIQKQIISSESIVNYFNNKSSTCA